MYLSFASLYDGVQRVRIVAAMGAKNGTNSSRKRTCRQAIAQPNRNSSNSCSRHEKRNATCARKNPSKSVRNILPITILNGITCHSKILATLTGSEEATVNGYAASRTPYGVIGITTSETRKTVSSRRRSDFVQRCASRLPV